MNRVGIFAGAFDPVHIGHITFAKNAAKKHNLSKVYFLAERRPRNKKNVTSFNHRIEMINKALTKEDGLSLLQLPESTFSVYETTQSLKKKLKGKEYIFLFGSDVAKDIDNWEGADQLTEIIVALRNEEDPKETKKQLERLKARVHFIDTQDNLISSSEIRKGRLENVPKPVAEYIKKQGLYSGQ